MRYIGIGAIAVACLITFAAVGADKVDEGRRIADKKAEVAKAELEKALESNRKAPGAITEVEIERLRLTYELAALDENADAAKRAAAQAAVAKAELEKALESNRKSAGAISELEIERLRRVHELAGMRVDEDAAKRAAAEAKVSEAELNKALDANRKVPGVVPAEVINRLRDKVRDDQLAALREELKSLREEVQQLHKTLMDLKQK
jgi:hypothetical protein